MHVRQTFIEQNHRSLCKCLCIIKVHGLQKVTVLLSPIVDDGPGKTYVVYA